MKIYLSGPMTGYPDLNRQTFTAARSLLADLGHEPVDPGDAEVPEQTWTAYMRADIRMLTECDALAVLPGWELSRGAALEVHIAQQLGMPVLPIATWAEVPA